MIPRLNQPGSRSKGLFHNQETSFFLCSEIANCAVNVSLGLDPRFDSTFGPTVIFHENERIVNVSGFVSVKAMKKI